MPSFDFTDEALATIAAALPKDAPTERVSLLPDLLRAWAKDDLCEHFSRKSRAVLRKEDDELSSISKIAWVLIEAVRDPDTRAKLAYRTQAHREAKVVTTRSGARFSLANVEQATQRCDDALSWLTDLAAALDEREPKPPPDTKTRNYLIVLDLAGIFELVTCDQPTRRVNAVTSKPYGPFYDFVNAVCAPLGLRSIDRAIQDVMKFYPLSKQAKLALRSLRGGFANAGRLTDATATVQSDRDPVPVLAWQTHYEKESNRGLLSKAAWKRITDELKTAGYINLHGKSEVRLVQSPPGREYSPFVANLQFRYPGLWQKIKRTRRKF
jgi:hypothetical protein